MEDTSRFRRDLASDQPERDAYDEDRARESSGTVPKLGTRASKRPESARPPASVPPGPHVDVTLWVVLALGLFAIVATMLAFVW